MKDKIAEAEALLAEDHSVRIASAERIPKFRETNPDPPITFRASAPLRQKLDELAREQHRTRGNLIQHILWTYIHEHAEKGKR